MKTQIRNFAKVVVAGSVILMATSCQKDNQGMGNLVEQYATVIDVASDGTTTVVDSRLMSALVETADPEVSETNGLLLMKDDEKLARDIYSVLNAKWNSYVFANISRSESQHLGAVTLLLEMYSPADTSISAPGVFTNPDVQKLYNDLLSSGGVSLADAYKVGATIEDLDIRDLTALMAQTPNANIIMVYENLLKGSRNHLRAFTRQLTSLGIVYTPQYISQSLYDQITTTPFEKGKQYRMNGQNGNGKGKKGQGKQGKGSCNR